MIGTTTVMRAPWLFSGFTCDVRRHGPLLGQDNAAVLELLGLPAGAAEDLRDVLRCPTDSCKGHRRRGSTTGLRSQGCMVIPAGPGGGVEIGSGGGPVEGLAPFV